MKNMTVITVNATNVAIATDIEKDLEKEITIVKDAIAVANDT